MMVDCISWMSIRVRKYGATRLVVPLRADQLLLRIEYISVQQMVGYTLLE